MAADRIQAEFGARFIPEVLQSRSVIDELIGVSDDDALRTSRESAQREGLLVGISAGAAIHAALEVACSEVAGRQARGRGRPRQR